MEYGQFCPVAKATEVIGEKWTLLIIRELLMLYLKRSIVPEKLIGKETVIRFNFTDIHKYPDWWLVVKGEEVTCVSMIPGKILTSISPPASRPWPTSGWATIPIKRPFGTGQ